MIPYKYLKSILALLLGISTGTAQTDWLIDGAPYRAEVVERGHELELSNGLIRRTFRVAPNAATVGLDNLVTGESLLRGVKPEAIVKINGINYEVGGLKGQPNYAFLKSEWLNDMQADPSAMQYIGHEISEPMAPFEWRRVRNHVKNSHWPPKGKHLRMDYRMPDPRSLLKGKGLLPSDFGRKTLYGTNFNSLDRIWKITYSPMHERSSFKNEGKVGEIYTPANTAVFVEKELEPNAKIIEATFFTGTDNSKGHGPGITLEWPQRTVKFYLRPGGNDYDDGVAMFGLWDGERENKAAGGRQVLDMGKPWTLRYRITEDVVLCEAKPRGGDWRTIAELAPFDTMPSRVRIGKTNSKGEAKDADRPGELVRMQVMDYATYSSLGEDTKNGFGPQDITLSVHYELYDGIPVMAKWLTVKNNSGKDITINKFTSEIIAAVEYGSAVETREFNVPKPNIHVETDYAFSSFNVEDANTTMPYTGCPIPITTHRSII